MSKWRAKALEYFPALRMEIQAADSVGGLWVDLIAHLHSYYRSGPEEKTKESPELIRAVSMYAIWCDKSESQCTQEAAWIEFYDYFPKFALQCPELVYREIIADLVLNIGMAEIEKMGCSLDQATHNRFLADARQADDDRRRKPQKQVRRQHR
jgi:hypothetical protein